MSFDPNDEYWNRDVNYYTLWHFKGGQWRDYGKLPRQNPIYNTRARPFQVKLESDKWGLKAGWHIFYMKSTWYLESGSGATDTYKKLLRLRHVGKRIPENQTGYRDPTYFDDNWELIDEHTDTTTNIGWFVGDDMSGRGVYHPSYGIAFDSEDRDVSYPPNDGEWWHLRMSCWNEHFYFIHEKQYQELSFTEPVVPSPVMGQIPVWPGVLYGDIYGSYFQGYDNPWSIRRPLFFRPENETVEQPWVQDTEMPEHPYPWLVSTLGFMGSRQTRKWISNFFFTVCPFHQTMDEFGTWYPNFQGHNYAIYQGPRLWRPISGSPADDLDPIEILENSIWDWAYDGACAQYDMTRAYVRRKSDGSIWRFRNWNPSTDIYTDFTNLEPRPMNPIQGVEYAHFLMNGPPIPGNETWHTLMILR